jgi:hypothetical protein
MADANKNHPEIVPKEEQKQPHIRSEMRFLVELFSLATIFFLTAILSFSASFATQPSEVTLFNETITFPYNQIAFWVIGSIYGFLFLFSLVLMLIPSKARSLGEWVEYSDSKINWVFWKGFWPLLWIAIVYPVFFSIIDASRGMPTTLGRDIALISGLFIYLVSGIIMFIKIPSKRKK